MKLTDKHVSEETINDLIKYLEHSSGVGFNDDLVYCLLELKQRRAEDRHRYFLQCKNNDIIFKNVSERT